MALEHMDRVVQPARRKAAVGSQGEVTHLSLDAAGHGATATGTHVLLEHFVENPLPGERSPSVIPRGEWPPRAVACDGRREGCG